MILLPCRLHYACRLKTTHQNVPRPKPQCLRVLAAADALLRPRGNAAEDQELEKIMKGNLMEIKVETCAICELQNEVSSMHSLVAIGKCYEKFSESQSRLQEREARRRSVENISSILSELKMRTALTKADFEIQSAIGEGQFGEVFLVKHRESGRLVALKVKLYNLYSILSKVCFRSLQRHLEIMNSELRGRDFSISIWTISTLGSYWIGLMTQALIGFARICGEGRHCIGADGLQKIHSIQSSKVRSISSNRS